MEQNTAPFARDLDLVREILVWIEGGSIKASRPCPADVLKFGYHCKLMKEAELIEALILERPTSSSGLVVERVSGTQLRWKGHDALAVMRADTIWTKTKALMAQHGLPMMFTVALAVAKEQAKKLGIDVSASE